MMITKTDNRQRTAERRRASTLTEVLVAIMILSIGIISLATLFPISILRSLQATQLTNGTILRYNAETAIDVTPALVSGAASTEYIVDPLGYARAAAADRNTLGGMTRVPGLTGSSAVDAVTLPDSWVFHVDGTGTLPSTTSFTFDEVTAAELTSVPFGGNTPSRIVLFDTSGKTSQVRTITGIAGTTISWSGDINYQVGIARIETKETRYTWLLTVRNNASSVKQVDVVVFFRRPDPPAGESPYAANFTKGVQVATINFTGEGPDLKQGGFVLDATPDDGNPTTTNGHWYRIQKITRTSAGATLQLNRPALESGNEAVVMEGVIDVYPIDDKGL